MWLLAIRDYLALIFLLVQLQRDFFDILKTGKIGIENGDLERSRIPVYA